ncbi:hypothetical protein PTTW11_04188 [Pyrenophora teres f. teres]|uniref:DUF7730 domain-containing protein n=1 Tax=Pyrenophora teres f. teres TaxID=97479 RepID=A0A6S6VZ53_9PLEO|nr:hypothetical protein PTTW11_04188 [Pyrenophora teres f. teres]
MKDSLFGDKVVWHDERPISTKSPSRLSAREAEAITVKNQTDSPFLCLPAELRIQIYNYALRAIHIQVDKTPGHTGSRLRLYVCLTGDVSESFRGIEWNATPSLGFSSFNLWHVDRTCRQMRSEIGLLPYKLNEFHVTLQTLGFFLSKLPQKIKEVITNIVINIDGHLWAPAKEQFEGLRTFTALETIVLDCASAQTYMPIRAGMIKVWIKSITGKNARASCHCPIPSFMEADVMS